MEVNHHVSPQTDWTLCHWTEVLLPFHRIKYEHIPVDMWTYTAVWIRIRKADIHALICDQVKSALTLNR